MVMVRSLRFCLFEVSYKIRIQIYKGKWIHSILSIFLRAYHSRSPFLLISLCVHVRKYIILAVFFVPL